MKNVPHGKQPSKQHSQLTFALTDGPDCGGLDLQAAGWSEVFCLICHRSVP